MSCFRRLIPLLALLLLASFAGILQGADRHPLTFEDLFGMKRLADVQVSPDGQWAAFVQTTYSIEKNAGNSDIWLVSLSTGRTRQLTNSPAADNHPRWLPDGKEIAFLSTRDGGSQIWKIAVDGGEAVRLTSLYIGVDSFLWSPAGDFFLFTAEVWPDAPSDELNKRKDEEKAQSKCTGKVLDKLFFRQWNRWVNDKFTHLFRYDLKTAAVTELTPGRIHCPPLDLGNGHDYAVSPDGRMLAWAYNPDSQPAATTNNDVYLSRDGRVECLTKANAANDFGPSFSPDGRSVAWLAMKRPGFEADKVDILLRNLTSGATVNLTEKWDLSVEEYVWSPDGRVIYLVAEDRARKAIFRIAADGSGPVEPLLGDGYNSGIRVAPDGKSLVFLRQTSAQPDDVYVLPLNPAAPPRPVTRVNAGRLAGIEMNPLEEFWFTGAKGEKVHGVYVKPPQFDPAKKYPVVLLIHGGPQGAFGDDFHYRWNAQMFAAPGWIAVMINFHGSRGYGQKFTDAVSQDWGGAPYEDIMLGLDHFLSICPSADKTRIAAAGASYGGFMINWIAGHSDRFRALVSHDGVFDQRSMHGGTEEVWFPEWEFKGKPWEAGSLYEKWSPCNYVQNFKTPMLVVHSELDYRVPVGQGFQLFTALQRMGVDSRMLYFPDEDHFVKKPQNARLWWATVYDWIGGHVK